MIALPASASLTGYLAYIPSPSQGVWHLGPLPIRAYALCIIVGIIVAIYWGNRRWVARGGRNGLVTDIAVFAVPFGLVGGRLYHVATDWYRYFGPGRNPLDALKVWDGGLGIWGAVALGAVGAWIGCRRRGVPLAAFADTVAPGIVLAQGIGRLGNYFNQELYGAPTTLPWGLEIYNRVDPGSGLPDPLGGVAINHTPVAVVHPTFLYELIWDVGVAVLVWWVDRKFRLGHGRAFALYVVGYTAGRTWIEMMRTDDATHIFGVRINVFTSLIVLVCGLAYFVLVKGTREEPALLLGKPLTAGQAAGPETSPDPADDPGGDEYDEGADAADSAVEDTAVEDTAADDTVVEDTASEDSAAENTATEKVESAENIENTERSTADAEHA